MLYCAVLYYTVDISQKSHVLDVLDLLPHGGSRESFRSLAVVMHPHGEHTVHKIPMGKLMEGLLYP